MTESHELVVSLTDSSIGIDQTSPSRVGGKASSLAKLFSTEGIANRVPEAHALTVDFFNPWIQKQTQTKTFEALSEAIADNANQSKITALCQEMQAASLTMTLSDQQSRAIQTLEAALKGRLAAVRSSAPEEDGSGASFAGAFETKLVVETNAQGLEDAVKACYASLWDYRVLSYKQQQGQHDGDTKIGFCVVVMEMIDSVVAGVAFSVNPLNSDRDETVIDSSWGLGESVVDGSVTTDRYIVNKLTHEVVEETIGQKGNEKRLVMKSGGGVVTKTIQEDNPRYSQSTLNPSQIKKLSELVGLVEETYGMPMDVEWAFVETKFEDEQNNDKEVVVWTPKLLQARPITTLFMMDEAMMTKPGEKRRLYFDCNIMSEATTTNPFHKMDMDVFCNLLKSMTFGMSPKEADAKGLAVFNGENPDSLTYNGATRQYFNLGYGLRFVGTEYMSELMKPVDLYLASIVAGKDCNRDKYKTNYWLPRGFSFDTVWHLIKFAMKSTASKEYDKDPKGGFEKYWSLLQSNMGDMDKVIAEMVDDTAVGIKDFSIRIFDTMEPSFMEELIIIQGSLLRLFNELDKQRRNGATEEIKKEYEALCGGYEGDELMEINIALYRLAQSVPKTIWKEYKGNLNAAVELADRIKAEQDLPPEFLAEWKSFMNNYGFDGQDQLFVGCPRYQDSPELLVEKLRLNAMGHVKDPSIHAKEALETRRAVMEKQLATAQKELTETQEEKSPLSFWKKWGLKKEVAKVEHRNQILDHLMRVRNAPKIHMTKMVGVGAIRSKALKIEKQFVSEGRLEKTGDIFHLTMDEVDQALDAKDMDLKSLVSPRKAVYQRALASNMCPILVDSRCRILKPDPPPISNEPGTLIGAAISPGVATGKVRIIRDLSTEQTKGFGVGPDGESEDHVLCAVVTGPAWTPLFASASAVVLQVGGVLQHGALCAREYGKPAVSNIDVYSLLKDGMTVSVDGNTGIVKIFDDGVE